MMMKFIARLFTFYGLLFSHKHSAQVGVNILLPHPSAALQVESPTGTPRGLLTPSMTSVNRVTISSSGYAADGLIVYDTDHSMHYYYQQASSRWISMGSFVLSTSAFSSPTAPSGYITTPQTASAFSVGINNQNPSAALDVIGNSVVSGNVNVGGNTSVTGSVQITGNTSVSGSLSVQGFPLNSLIPAGLIAMWSGSVLPAGWAVCDGGTYNGLTTPDLRGRFIVGINNSQGSQHVPSGLYLAVGSAGQTPNVAPNDGVTLNYGAIGNTGGESGHNLNLAEMPAHTHNVSINFSNTTNLGFDGDGSTHTIPVGNGSSSGRSQTLGYTISETPKGADQVHENRPPYYVLAYIIKLP